MVRTTIRLLTAVAIALAASLSAHFVTASAPAAHRGAGIDTKLMLDLLEEIRQREPFSGTIAVSKAGRIVLARSFGYADATHRTRNSLNLGGNGPVWSAFDVLGTVGRGLYPPALSLSPEALHAYAGSYAGTATVRGHRWHVRVVVSVSGRGLAATGAEPFARLRLLAGGEDEFFNRLNPDWTFHFLRAGAGRLERLDVRLPWLPAAMVLHRAP